MNFQNNQFSIKNIIFWLNVTIMFFLFHIIYLKTFGPNKYCCLKRCNSVHGRCSDCSRRCLDCSENSQQLFSLEKGTAVFSRDLIFKIKIYPGVLKNTNIYSYADPLTNCELLRVAGTRTRNLPDPQRNPPPRST